MSTQNKIFIATSIDGYIADKDGGIAWLSSIPNPANDDMGYSKFMAGIDAILMGRVTYETILGFGIEWPFQQPVFVLSQSLKALPEELKTKVKLVNGPLKAILANIALQGYTQLYIDGGKTIQSFLKEDLIQEMTITIIPTLLGGGTPLFSSMSSKLDFECISSTIYLDKVVQHTFARLV